MGSLKEWPQKKKLFNGRALNSLGLIETKSYRKQRKELDTANSADNFSTSLFAQLALLFTRNKLRFSVVVTEDHAEGAALAGHRRSFLSRLKKINRITNRDWED